MKDPRDIENTFIERLITALFLIACIFLLGRFIIQKIIYLHASSKAVPAIKIAPPVRITSEILLDVPFTSQAPTADWKNPIFADGCEETSAVMAMHWVYHTPITVSGALKEIVDITHFETEKFGGFFPNISAQDTVTLMKEYYGYQNILFVPNITTNDIKIQLVKGNVVIVPTDSQKLHNPHYTGVGSPTHMIVVIGYDPATHEFITNDPGTRYGAQYRYPESVLGNALRDYPTGPYQKEYGTAKDMIVVEPQ